MSQDKRGAWKVDFTLPPTDKRRWVSNMHATVVAENLERVVQVMIERYPNCTLVAIHRVGSEREVIIDDGS